MARDWVIERQNQDDDWSVLFGPAGMMECLRAFSTWGNIRHAPALRLKQPVFRIRKQSTGEIIPGDALQ